MPGRTIALLIGGVAVLAVVIFLARQLPGLRTENQPAPVRTAAVPEGSTERILRITGSTVGQNNVTLRAPYLRGSRTRGGGGGFNLVLKDLVAEGTAVAKDDIVATFDRQELMDRLDNLKAERDQAEGTVKSLQATLLAAREAREQKIRVAKAAVDSAVLDLKTAPVRSAIQADLFKLNLEEAQATYKELISEATDFEVSQKAQERAAELEADQTRIQVSRAEASSERMVVRAPRAGRVVISQVFRGGTYNTIRAGDQLRPGQPYLDIVAPGPMMVEALVNQADVIRLRIGDSATVTPDAFPDIRLPARVYAVGGMAVSDGWRGNYVRNVPVLIKISKSDPRVLPSLTVSVDVKLDPWKEGTPTQPEAHLSEPPAGAPVNDELAADAGN
jgi:multidrug resistance efflux pump